MLRNYKATEIVIINSFFEYSDIVLTWTVDIMYSGLGGIIVICLLSFEYKFIVSFNLFNINLQLNVDT